MTIKLGSLFDGSGGFPLAGAMCGIEPVWAAEVEPYPIAVTRSRFPNMKHLGDISKVSGTEIEPVDIITFGSPCQDLSVAGLRKGLKHEVNGDEETTRSGLFMEAVRIIKEMRRATNGQYPRFALWENVPGAFSSNKGEDFRIVCEELIKIIEPSAVMPSVPQKGWAYADSYCGDGWSLAYRVFDAQYWGVPQRRRRIHLVVDFGGQCAREILFERQGLRGYFAEGRAPWQAVAADAERGSLADDREGGSTGGRGRLDAVGADLYNQALTGDKAATLSANSCMTSTRNGPSIIERRTPEAAYTMVVRSGRETDSSGRSAGKGALIQTERASTLNTVQDQYLFQPTAYSFDPLSSNSMKSKNPHSGCREVEVARTIDTTDPNPSKNQGGLAIVEPIPIQDQATRFAGKRGDKQDGKGNGLGVGAEGDPVFTLTGGDRHAVAIAEPVAYNGENITSPTNAANPQPGDPCRTLGTDSRNYICIPVADRVRYIVRRLTPTECARLQGFADWHGHLEKKTELTDEEHRFWMDVRNTHAAINGKAVKDYTKPQMLTWYNKLWTDGAEYKMWGNGIALPPALYCMQGITEVLSRKVQWSKPGPCPVTPEQFEAIYNDEEGDDSWLL